MRDFLINLLFLCGVALVLYCLWRIWEPLAFGGGGVVLILVALAIARANDEYRRRSDR